MTLSLFISRIALKYELAELCDVVFFTFFIIHILQNYITVSVRSASKYVLTTVFPYDVV